MRSEVEIIDNFFLFVSFSACDRIVNIWKSFAVLVSSGSSLCLRLLMFSLNIQLVSLLFLFYRV